MTIGMAASATITNPSIGNAATISTIDPIKANAYLNFGFPYGHGNTWDRITAEFSVELWEDGFWWDTQIGDTHTFNHEIYELDGEYCVQRDEIGSGYEKNFRRC